jgi:hypothetical protein
MFTFLIAWRKKFACKNIIITGPILPHRLLSIFPYPFWKTVNCGEVQRASLSYKAISLINFFLVFVSIVIHCSETRSLTNLSRTTRTVEVEVTLRPTVSRPVRLGVLSFLAQVIRGYLYLSDNYFLYFPCRGRVCNLQCNDTSSFSSYIATDGLSATSSWCRTPNGAHNQILISLFDSYFVFSV